MPVLGIVASSIRSWAPTGAYDALATINVASSVASVSFAGIPQNYKHLQISILGRSNRASVGESVRINFNGDNTTSYTDHEIYGDGTTLSAYGATAAGFPTYRIAGGNAATNVVGAILVDILDYASPTKYKVGKAFGGISDGTTQNIAQSSSIWTNKNPISTIDLTPVGSWQANSQITLYGVR